MCECGAPIWSKKRGLCRRCYHRAWRNAHPENITQYRAQTKAQRLAHRQPCERCGEPIELGQQNYCKMCAPVVRAEKAKARKHRTYDLAKERERKVRTGAVERRKQKAKCAARRRRVARLAAGTVVGPSHTYTMGWCLHCGEAFVSTHQDAKYCTPRCGRRAKCNNRRHNRRAGQLPTKTCRTYKRRVWERDGGLCGVCQKPIDLTVHYPDPQSWSEDHIVPLSRGGTHEWANVQSTHWACNVSKGSS